MKLQSDFCQKRYLEEMEYKLMLGSYGPELIERLAKEWNIPKNFLFISSPGEKYSYRVEDLGGITLIL